MQPERQSRVKTVTYAPPEWWHRECLGVGHERGRQTQPAEPLTTQVGQSVGEATRIHADTNGSAFLNYRKLALQREHKSRKQETTMAFDVLLRECTGQTCGAFPGTSIRNDHTDKIEIISFEYELIAPKDPQRGPQATGRRQHKPIRICKNLDATTPIFFNACATNEFLTGMTFEFWQTNAEGVQEIYLEIGLENAAIASIKYTTGFEGTGNLQTSRGHSQYDLKELEYIDLVFETIKIDHKVGTVTAAQDSWKH